MTKARNKISLFTKQFKIVLVILFSSFYNTGFNQCTNVSSFGSATAPTTTTPLTISTCTFNGEYNTIFSVVAGQTYSSTNSSGGCITVHSGTPAGPVVAWGLSPLSWTATVSGTYYIHYNVNCACATGFSCITTTITCTSCGGGGGGGDPCTSIVNIPACGSSVTANLSGTGFGWSIPACGFTTAGDEQIYSFTPAVTGTYSLNVTSASGGFIDYFWVNSTSGCSSAAPWNCIDDIISTGTYGSMSWTAGQTYYILLDPESSFGTASQTFSINCPAADPCLSIVNIPACGTVMTANLSGTGAWNLIGCFFGTPGDEQIYSFTPATTGIYSFNVATFAGPSSVDFLVVNSTSGCSSLAPWTCVDDAFTTGNTAGVSLTAGQTYYILLDPEFAGAYNLTFSVNCPGAVVTAGDCASAVNVCTNLTFAIDPNGFGAINEIPALGTLGNPDLIGGDFALSTWGSDNWGCLRSGELNSTWMVINVATTGTLEFTFGAGTGFNCYDWIMYPYNATACAQIPGGSYAPIRCNWNSPCAEFTGIATPLPGGGAPGNFEPELNVIAGQQYIVCFSNFSSAFTSVPLNFFGTASVSCTPLANELSTFDGYKKNEDVLLTWNTLNETNSSHYQILHSTNGFEFTSAGLVEAQGLNSSTTYSFTHTNPSNGINYYKLVSVDLNNQSTESGTLAIDFSKEEIMINNIFPNPSSGLSYVNITAEGNNAMKVSFTDITGRIVAVQNVELKKGNNTIEINTGILPKGMYNFIVSNTGNQVLSVQKLIVE
jgi:hypothetical protein